MRALRVIGNNIRGNKLYKRITGRYVGAAIIIYLCVTLFYYQDSISENFTANKTSNSGTKQFDPDKFYFTLFEALADHVPLPRPELDELRDDENCVGGDITKSPTAEMFSKASYQNLDSCMHLSAKQLSDLKKKHEKFVKLIDSDLQISSENVEKIWPNKEGIVTIGGGRFSVISISMLETLREKGSTLPVEVIIPPEDEDDDDYCNNVLPKLNAKCVFFSDALPQDLINKLEIKRFQYKTIGLLLSSFQNILFLDADNLPLENIDNVFKEPLFIERGLILWPDMWRRATTPAFYDVAGIEYDLSKRARFLGDDISPVSRYQNPATNPNLLNEVPMHDLEGFMPDPTSESGQLMVDKVHHLSTLILATYYNVHSTWYYRMLSQGTAGEGDKETFLAAAYALKMPHYQVKTGLLLDGFIDHEKAYHGVSLYQHDFQQDYEQHERAKKHIQENIEEFSKFNPVYSFERDFIQTLMKPTGEHKINVLFAHIGYHKFDPFQMATEGNYLDKEGQHFRGFTRYEVLQGFDLELFTFEKYHKYLCSSDPPPVDFKYYRDKNESSGWKKMCTYLKNRVEFLNSTHEEYLQNTQKALNK